MEWIQAIDSGGPLMELLLRGLLPPTWGLMVVTNVPFLWPVGMVRADAGGMPDTQMGSVGQLRVAAPTWVERL